MKVKFIPQNIELDADPDQSIMKLAHENGIYIKSICNGMPSCAECRVRVTEGEGYLLPPTRKELSLIGSGYFIDHRRLSCQMRCFGDIVVDLSEQVEKEKVSTHRRPQGNLKKESSEESLAVVGNLIDQDKDLVQEEIKDVSTSDAEVEKEDLNKDFLGGHNFKKNSSKNRNSKQRRKSRNHKS